MFRALATTFIFFGFILLGVQAAAHADVYRWVDSQGIVQYSDRWVPGSVLVKVDKNKQSSEALAARLTAEQAKLAASNTAIANQQTQADTARAVQKDLAKVREDQCKEATDRYDKAIRARRIFRTDKDGKREYVSDAEADAYRAEALKDKQTACGPQGK